MTKITIQLDEIQEHGDAWYDGGCWRALAGRLILQWRDDQEHGPHLLVTGTDDARLALKQAISDAELDPPIIESSAWADSVFAFRIRSPKQLQCEFGLDDDDIETAYQDGEDMIFDEVDSDGIDWHPGEPECPERESGKHRWIEGQAYGHGAGVQRTDECRTCGLKRHEDTAALDRSDGSQDNHSICYEDPHTGELLPLAGVPA